MVTETCFVLAHLAILGLELKHLLNEDLLVCKSHQILAEELELWRDIECSLDQFDGVSEKLDSQVILVLHKYTVLRVANVKSDGQVQALNVDVQGYLARVNALVICNKVISQRDREIKNGNFFILILLNFFNRCTCTLAFSIFSRRCLLVFALTSGWC